MTRTLPRDADDARALLDLNRRVVAALGMDRGAAHVEFIKSEADGHIYFLEAGARVGGANIVDVVEAAAGVNLWRMGRGWSFSESEAYAPPERKRDYVGVILTLARQEQPDTSAYTKIQRLPSASSSATTPGWSSPRRTPRACPPCSTTTAAVSRPTSSPPPPRRTPRPAATRHRAPMPGRLKTEEGIMNTRHTEDEQIPTCPRCHSAEVTPILYGLP